MQTPSTAARKLAHSAQPARQPGLAATCDSLRGRRREGCCASMLPQERLSPDEPEKSDLQVDLPCFPFNASMEFVSLLGHGIATVGNIAYGYELELLIKGPNWGEASASTLGSSERG